MAVIWNTSCKKILPWFCLIVIISASRTCNLFSNFFVLVINLYYINGLHLFWISSEWFRLKICCDAKYFFHFLSKALWSRINSLLFFSFLVYYFQIWNPPPKKKNTTLLLAELLTVPWVPCILRQSAYIYIYIYWVSRNNRAVSWFSCILRHPICYFSEFPGFISYLEKNKKLSNLISSAMFQLHLSRIDWH